MIIDILSYERCTISDFKLGDLLIYANPGKRPHYSWIIVGIEYDTLMLSKDVIKCIGTSNGQFTYVSIFLSTDFIRSEWIIISAN